LWVVFLQLAVPVAAILVMGVADGMMGAVSEWSIAALVYLFQVTLIIGGPMVFLLVYFAEYAPVFAGKRGFHALLFSRDLMRKRFFRVATRITVFLAVGSGYGSWAAAVFFVVSLILGPVGVLTGYFWTVIFLVELAAVAVGFSTAAFFVAA